MRPVGAHLSQAAGSIGGGASTAERGPCCGSIIEENLDRDPDQNLLVYGDFNDTRDQPAVQEILGPRQGPLRLKEVLLTDAQGDRWTYYRRLTDSYDRFDYVLADSALWPTGRWHPILFISINRLVLGQ